MKLTVLGIDFENFPDEGLSRLEYKGAVIVLKTATLKDKLESFLNFYQKRQMKSLEGEYTLLLESRYMFFSKSGEREEVYLRKSNKTDLLLEFLNGTEVNLLNIVTKEGTIGVTYINKNLFFVGNKIDSDVPSILFNKNSAALSNHESTTIYNDGISKIIELYINRDFDALDEYATYEKKLYKLLTQYECLHGINRDSKITKFLEDLSLSEGCMKKASLKEILFMNSSNKALSGKYTQFDIYINIGFHAHYKGSRDIIETIFSELTSLKNCYLEISPGFGPYCSEIEMDKRQERMTHLSFEQSSSLITFCLRTVDEYRNLVEIIVKEHNLLNIAGSNHLGILQELLKDKLSF